MLRAGAAIVMDSAFVVATLLLSAALTVMVKVPAAVGVPLTLPPALKDRPGTPPDWIDQVQQPIPPLAERV
jgi:hypothetical protein